MGLRRGRNVAADIVELNAVDGQLVTGSCVIMGIVVTDEAAGAVQVHFHNGTANTDPHVGAVSVSANSSSTVWYGPNGISCPDGIYQDTVSGTPSGSVFISR